MKYNNEQYIEADDYYDMSLAWIDNGNIEKAIECLNHVIELNPRFIYAYITMAEIYASKGNYHDAIRVLRHGRHQDQAFDKIYYLLAYYSDLNGERKNALSFINRALQLNPDNEEYQSFKKQLY